jgi:predicted restriction endonuclease
MDERLPVTVFKQLTDKTDRKFGSTYQVLGLGLITRYEKNSDVFFVESVDRQALEEVTYSLSNEVARYQVQLYAQVMNVFQPFVKEKSITYTTSMPKRDKVFRDIVVHEYDFTCAVCET